MTRTIRIAAALAVGLLATLGGQARAQALTPVGQAARDLCVKHGGRQIDVIDAADADGYTPAPGNFSRSVNGMTLEGAVARTRASAGGTVFLITGSWMDKGTFFPVLEAARLDVCAVIVQARQPGLVDEATGWMGLPPAIRETPNEGMFVFTDTPEGRRSVADMAEPQIVALARAGKLQMLMVRTEPKMTMAVLMTPRAHPGAGVAAGAVAPPAPGESAATPFNDFKTLCIDRRGVIADSIKAADEAGWMEAPSLLEDGEEADFPYPMTEGVMRLKSTDDDLEMFFAGPGRLLLGWLELKMDLCTIVQAPPNDTALLKAVEDWVGLTPVEIAPDGSRTYIFVEEGGRNVPLPTKNFDANLARKFKTAKISIVVMQRGGVISGASYASYGVLTQVVSASLPSAYAMADGR